MRALVAAVLVTGCGRVAFDPRGDGGTAGDDDAPVDTPLDAAPHGSLTHDEDNDGVADGLDPCPHLAGDMADGDGDGVGDACDTDNASPRQRITRFESFEAGVPADLNADPGWVQRSDAIGWPGPTFGFVEWNPHAVGDVDIAVGWDILSIPAAASHQIVVALDQAGGTRTYGEVYEDASGAFTSVTHFDGTNYINYDQNNFGVITTGRLDMAFHAAVNPRDVDFRATWMGTPTYRSATSAVSLGPSPALGVTVRDLDVELRYLLVIETN
jgi:hypothetical protein